MLLLALITGGFPVRAQEVKALPVPAVESEPIPMLGKAPIVIELFSSQACVFCPKADRLFADLLKQDNVIGLACHIDYFDVREGALSRPFCTKRQNWYMEVLGAGPNYTPQMVVNGMHDVIGYKFDSVIKTLQRSSYSEIKPLTLTQTKAKGTWKLTLPLDKLPPKENLQLWLALYDEPHALNIAEGRNKGKKTVYYNIVSSLGSTTAEISKEVFVTPPLKAGHAGFVVILQDMQSGQIYGVARHKIKTS
jgi:hypothetical protein